LSLPDIESRVRLVNAQIDGIKKLPSVKRSLRYQTPVSQPLQTEELFFECHAGRITLIDVGAMLEQVRRERDDKAKLLADAVAGRRCNRIGRRLPNALHLGARARPCGRSGRRPAARRTL